MGLTRCSQAKCSRAGLYVHEQPAVSQVTWPKNQARTSHSRPVFAPTVNEGTVIKLHHLVGDLGPPEVT